MYSALTLGVGHRVWWTLGIHRIALGIGMPDGLKDWAYQQADRVNRHGLLEVSHARTLGCVALVWWSVSHPETT